MGYEIDFWAVGEGSKGGDAISLRWGDLDSNEHFIAVIDAGFSKDGEKLVKSIKQYYGYPDTINLVVSTHPDADHINGLSHILDKFEVEKLWLHQPWKHNYNIASEFQDGRVTDDSIAKRLKEAYEAAEELCEKAEKRRILVEEPFSCNESLTIASHGGELKILGPSKAYYEKLLPEFNGLPKPVDISTSTHTRLGMHPINDNEETSATNNSSVILELSYNAYEGKRRFVFTADAGIPALEQAAGKAGPRNQLELIQIPHHGSERNVETMVLNYLVGDINGNRSLSAIVSCPKEDLDDKHPNKRVLNAFTLRGCDCYTTGGSSFRYSRGAPGRDGWIKATPCGLYREVEGGL